MAFRVGQKVECFLPSQYYHEIPTPEVGDIATVANVYVAENGNLTLELIEFPAPETDEFYAGWRAYRFRPLITKSTDAGFSILEEIRKRESVPADDHVREKALSFRQREGSK